MENFLNEVEVVYTNPTPHGGDVMFQYHGRLYMMKLHWREGEVETTLASQTEDDPIVLNEKYQSGFLVALKRFMVAHTEGEFKYYVKEPKDIFIQGIKAVKIFGNSKGVIHIVFEFGGLLYALKDVFLIKNKDGSWIENIEESSVVHFNVPLEPNRTDSRSELSCQCGFGYGGEALSECEYMDALLEWVWEGINRNSTLETIHDEYVKKSRNNSKVLHLKEAYNPFK